jgi:hypothetical protein
MPKRALQLLVAASLVPGVLWAANDPFSGKWKLDPSKSKFTDQVKVEDVGPNRYAITFVEPGLAGNVTDTVVADGTEQPAIFGTTLSVTAEGADTWKVVRKKSGRMLLSAVWKLSEDGNTLSDAFTGYQADGSTSRTDFLYKRTAGRSGFPGTWENTSEKVDSDSAFEFQIQPHEGDGLSVISPTGHELKRMKFDGKDYPDVSPYAAPGSASSVRRVNERTLEETDKIEGKVTQTVQLKVSPDLKILTMTSHPMGQSRPNILVFDRE